MEHIFLLKNKTIIFLMEQNQNHKSFHFMECWIKELNPKQNFFSVKIPFPVNHLTI